MAIKDQDTGSNLARGRLSLQPSASFPPLTILLVLPYFPLKPISYPWPSPFLFSQYPELRVNVLGSSIRIHGQCQMLAATLFCITTPVYPPSSLRIKSLGAICLFPITLDNLIRSPNILKGDLLTSLLSFSRYLHYLEVFGQRTFYICVT